MPNLKQIRKRIRSVTSTQQITRVMEMVSASKLARTQTMLMQARPYAQGLEGLIRRVVGGLLANPEGPVITNPLMQPREEINRRCMVVFTSDRGLCGAYNNNVIALAERQLDGDQEGWTLVCVGKKCLDYFENLGWSVGYQLIETGGRVQGEDVHVLSAYLLDGYAKGNFDEVVFAFTEFKSASRYVPTTSTFLPLKSPEQEEEGSDSAEYIFEPDEATVLDRLLPDYLAAKLNTTLYEALASEHAARMTAMHNATENAGEMISNLTLDMNKARQAAITTEISEIVSGAESIKG